MKKLPLGIQNFREIASGDYVYIDKTRYIYAMLNDGAKCYFLSRPRRFGKSLLLDTIGEVFSGEKELFKGLWIHDSDYCFEKHPVIRLDMSSIANGSTEIFIEALTDDLRIRIMDEGFDIPDNFPSIMFKRLILAMYKKYSQKIVVLIDEYDMPILDRIDNLNAAHSNRQVLRMFYGILKSMDRYLRFTFITGVTKFSKTSIFSGLNNLFDIRLSLKFSNICGITIDDLNSYFGSHLGHVASLESFKHYESVYSEILAWYDGYSWDGETRVINPFSLLNFFAQERFSGYWYSSGTPAFLLGLIKKNPDRYSNYKSFEITESMLDSVDIDKITVAPLLFQTGYLTIKEIPLSCGEPMYILDIPNNEVRQALNVHIISALTEIDDVATGQMRMAVHRALHSGDLPGILEILRGFFASIPYELHVDLEAYYHSIFYAFMSALGFDLDVEVSVARGRVDAILELDDKVYIMEMKYCKCLPDSSAEQKRNLFDKALGEAMEQIDDKGYAAKYQGSGKAINKAAFVFLGRGDIEMRYETI